MKLITTLFLCVLVSGCTAIIFSDDANTNQCLYGEQHEKDN